jgi:gliding motility-associated-like protein
MITVRHSILVLLFIGIFVCCKGQCTFSLGPDICQQPPINFSLNGPAGYDSYAWSTGSKNSKITITTTGTYSCIATKLGTDLVRNGDFEDGYADFSSTYQVGTTGPFGPLSVEGTYIVINDPNKAHTNFPFFGDHTSGKGNMIIINGNSVKNASVWCQSITVVPNTNYNFSTWAATCNAATKAELAQLQFSINGSVIGSIFSPSLTVGVWSQFSATWNSGNTTTANICIVNQNITLLGNDFALDDIFLQEICVATDTVKILSAPVIKANAGPDQISCAANPVQLAGSLGGGAAGNWSGGTGTYAPNNTSPTAVYTPSAAEVTAGTVTLKFMVTSGMAACPGSDEDQMTITIGKIANVTAGSDQTICTGSSAQLAGSIGAGTAGTWSGGTGIYVPNNTSPTAVYTPSATEQTTGKVQLKFTVSSTACPAESDDLVINIDQLSVAIAGDTYFICEGADIPLHGKLKGAATEGVWSGGNGVFTPNNKTLSAIYAPSREEVAAGKVSLKLTPVATGVCPVNADSVAISIYPNPIVKFAVDVPKACTAHCVNFFDTTTAGVTNVVKWDWNFGIKGIPHSSAKNPKGICFDDAGRYDVTLTATSDKGCRATTTKRELVETYASPVAEFTVNPNTVTASDPTVHFSDQSSADVKSWKWNFGDGKMMFQQTKDATYQYQVGVSGIYTVKLFVINANGCVDSIQHQVKVEPEFSFFIPNAFTPGEKDGDNDTFVGKGVGIVQYHIRIFDRWGNMIFDTTNINTGWDGQARNGGDVAVGDVYVWKVELTDVFGKKHAYIGSVTLAR